MNKKKIICITLIVILILCYLGKQAINYFLFYNIEYNTANDYKDWMDNFEIINTINVSKNDIESDDYLTFQNIKIRNDFKDYTKLDESVSGDDSVKYVLYDDNNESVASFWIWTSNSYVDIFKGDLTVFGSNDNILSTTDRIKFLEKNNINNDIDLIKYIINNKNIKNKFFMSTKKMKENYTMQYFYMTLLPKAVSVTLIEGDFSGYMLNVTNNIKEVHILNDDEVLGFTFVNSDYYSDEYIIDLLGTLVVE